MTSNSAVLRLHDVTVRRGGKAILSQVNWTVNEGEHWVILGANGAGKTTISRLAGARLHPSSGIVEVLGEQLGKADVAELHPLVGLCSSALAARVSDDERAIDFVLSASYGVIGRGREEYEDTDIQRAQDLLNVLGAGPLAERRWKTLSSGERKRVEIARALMPDPELLVLDEPASGLDLAGREELLSAITEIISDPAAPTVILVTHHLEEIPRGMTHALALKDGAVVASGGLAEVVASEPMSLTFGLNLAVSSEHNRFSARAV